MKEENKHCYNCMYYGPLYSKKFCSFVKEKYGLCMSKNVKEKNEVCGKWSYNNELNRRVRKESCFSASLNVIDEIFKNLTEISQILREEQEAEILANDYNKN